MTIPAVSDEDLRVAALVLCDVAGQADELNRLDSVAGDGDLGITATAATTALIQLLGELEPSEPAEALRRCGMAIARAAPSSMGTLVARAFLAAAREEPEGGGVAASAAWLDAGRRSIELRGGATIGQKSMLDALAPAITALQANSDASVAQAVEAAADAAEAGAEATKQMDPVVGRASWLADRSRGNVDAGAWLVAFVFRSWAERMQEVSS